MQQYEVRAMRCPHLLVCEQCHNPKTVGHTYVYAPSPPLDIAIMCRPCLETTVALANRLLREERYHLEISEEKSNVL